MDGPLVYVALPLIAFAAFFLKTVSGFGPALVVVALASLILPPQTVVAVSSLLDAVAGIALFAMDPDTRGRRFWLPLALAIVAGSIGGGILLSVMDPELFRTVLATAIILLGVWFGLLRARGDGGLSTELPQRASSADVLATGLGGVMGGFLGISGPPILWHFGRRLAKEPLRALLIPIFLAAAIARVSTYAWTGVLNREVFLAFAIALPGLAAGILAGNRAFVRISEIWFGRIIGVILLLVGLRLLIR
jgi:uncharacterized membrane protein YfcA